MTKPLALLQSLLAWTKPKPVRLTLGAQVRRALARALVLSALVSAPLVGAHALPSVLPLDLDVIGPTPSQTVEPPEEPGAAEVLLERHRCWTGEAPADVEVPGGVVMSLAGQGPRYFGTDARVGQALDHIFGVADPRVGVVFGFCR